MNDLLGRVLPWVMLLAVVALLVNFLHLKFTEHFTCLTGL